MINAKLQYGIGQEAEMAFVEMLVKRDWAVLPASNFTNNTGAVIDAPMMLIPGHGMTICPDLHGFHPVKGRKWFEVSRKSEPTYYRKKNRYEHGKDEPNINDYKIVQDFYKEEVLIVIPEVASPIDTNILTDFELDPLGFQRKIRENLRTNPVWRWLYISLDDALKHGELRRGNSRMKKARNPDGWGYYWPRDNMRELDL